MPTLVVRLKPDSTLKCMVTDHGFTDMRPADAVGAMANRAHASELLDAELSRIRESCPPIAPGFARHRGPAVLVTRWLAVSESVESA